MKTLMTSLLLVCFAIPALGRDEPEPSPESTRAYRDGYNLILNGEWDAARAAFDNLIRDHAGSPWVDDAAFWRCYAASESGRPAEETFTCYEEFVSRHTRSEWKDDARRAMVRLAGELDRGGKGRYKDKVRDFGRGEDDRELLQVLVALGEIGDDRSIDIILQRLDATTDEHLRASIVDVLEDIESVRVAERLQSLATSDPSERVRLTAIDALSDQDTVDPLPLLRALANDPNELPRIRIKAMDELTDREPADIVSFLTALADTENDDVAEEAIDELSDLESREAFDALVELLGRLPDAERRMNILDEIEDFETDAAARALLNVARTDPDPRIRRAATDSLGDMETAVARDALIELLQSMDSEEG